MIKYVNTCKILIILPTYQPSNSALILEYNITNHLNFSLNNSKKDISPRVSNSGEKKNQINRYKQWQERYLTGINRQIKAINSKLNTS